MEINFTSTLEVELQGFWGDDLEICRSAWVSSNTDVEQPTKGRKRGVIRALVRDHHGSPTEDGFFKFRIYAPTAVRDEHVRHRIASYSSSSARYAIQSPVFWVPPPNRPLKRVPGSKQIQPQFECYTPGEYEQYISILKSGYRAAWSHQVSLMDAGFDSTEAVRWLNNDALMMPYIVRFNPRSLMHFLELRTHDERANHVSYPMWEIEQVARQIESVFADKLPLTYESWLEFGREAP